MGYYWVLLQVVERVSCSAALTVVLKGKWLVLGKVVQMACCVAGSSVSWKDVP